MPSSVEFIDVWCLSVKKKSGVVSLPESSSESQGNRSGAHISPAGLNEDMFICGLKETVLYCWKSYSKWGTTG